MNGYKFPKLNTETQQREAVVQYGISGNYAVSLLSSMSHLSLKNSSPKHKRTVDYTANYVKMHD
ncbi:MAG: hypothetical protein LBJ00_09590 [Planctomycetaceae bacterium]|nr:hypothetical protein [Planctomycetaceae bacterium]